MEKAPAKLASTSCSATATPAPTTPRAKLRRPKRSSKEESEEKQNREVSGKDDELANLIARIGPAKAPGQRLFEHAERGVNNEDSDGCGNALQEERKRNSLS